MSNRDLYIEDMENILSQHTGWLRAADLARKIRAKHPGSRMGTIGGMFNSVCRNHPEKFSRYEPKSGNVFYAWKKNVEGKPLPAKSKQTVPEQILQQMQEILPRYAEGVRYSDLRDMIHKNLPNRSRTVIGSHLKYVADRNPAEISREKIKGKGVFYSWVGSSVSVQGDQTDADAPAKTRRKESDFYDSFARFLEYQDDKDGDDKAGYLEECSKALVWGDKGGKPKWGNPDVIGVFRPEPGAVIDFAPEIVSAEIKVGNAELLTGFGQCCAYRLFSHKVYLVVPDSSLMLGRLEAMCHLMGIGLVVFNPAEKPDPSIFNVKLRARKQEPDAYHLNEAIPKDIIKKLYR